MSRESVIEALETYFDDGSFLEDLSRRVEIHTESQEPDQIGELYRYLTGEMAPYLEKLGFECQVHENPDPVFKGPFLVARRFEGDDLPTVFTYGHGDVVRGYDEQWRDGIGPWKIVKQGERWYGRGTADNKGQHTINLAAIDTVLKARGGKLGFNVVALIETGEETGSPGLREFCRDNKELLKADVLIASDGPRLKPETPTIFMGSRGVFNFTMRVNFREGGHHSGNWGGLLANPGIVLAHAVASLTTATGEIKVPGLKPPQIPNSVRNAISKLDIQQEEEGAPEINPEWGEPGLTPEEKVFGWNTLEVLSFKTGNPDNPVHAIPPHAFAHIHMRYVVPSDPATFLPAVRKHLDEHGFEMVELEATRGLMSATRLDPDHPWAKWSVSSLEKTAGEDIAVLPNLGGTLPNDAFADILGMPTIWIPHSYASCSQHAPNEHILESVSRSALRLMGGLFWDMGEPGTPT